MKMLGREVRAKTFVIVVYAALLLPLYLSASLVLLKIPTNKNQVVIWHQLAKLDEAGNDVDTVILGDSSAGMNIDIGLFERLTGRHAISLATTAAFGIQGNLLLMARCLEELPKLRNVMFVMSAAAWQIELVPESYYLLREGLPRKDDPLREVPAVRSARQGYLNWLFTPRRFVWLWHDLRQPRYEQGVWDARAGYIIQGPVTPEPIAKAKWAVHMAPPEPDDLTPYLRIWAGLCARVRCIYAKGPLYSGFAEKSADSLIIINRLIDDNLSPHLFYYDGDEYLLGYEKMGDSMNHVRQEYRDTATQHYAGIFNEAQRRATSP